MILGKNHKKKHFNFLNILNQDHLYIKYIILNYVKGMNTLGIPVRNIAEEIHLKILFDYNNHVPINYIINVLETNQILANPDFSR